MPDVDDLRRQERRQRTSEEVEALVAEIMAIAERCAARPVLDSRTLEEMLYDEHGLPK